MDKGNEESFPVGSWERPDAGGVVRRGAAVGFRDYAEKVGHAPPCFVRPCEQAAGMEVYGLQMCEAHGEEAASGALEEMHNDLDNELLRPDNGECVRLSPHFVAALHHGMESLPEPDSDRDDDLLLAAWPLERERADVTMVEYLEDPDARRGGPGPYDSFLSARYLVCRLMRLAFEKEADWLVEVLEKERESAAAQVAYYVALEKEAGLQRS